MKKHNRKSFKYSVYGILTACTVIFGLPYESRASWILEESSKFIEQKIVRTASNTIEDAETFLTRSIRPKSDDLLENAVQDMEDRLEDTWKVIKRKIIEPGKDFLKDWKFLK
ncbi:MAG: hypothetical protein J0H12_04850 [Candidatus Paracaedimonas acanthamoebae]|uniref:Uncharacterized protein n=1 Tax=Candidatus Paracaedimonas acanthamoebae TaxID=244581 RepID=A0A8J7TVP9_9PROT|nr:hypothetical protein [Candidatus Paracaedimonas acanthamoebae]